jgi:hypothetical protein
MKPKLDIDRLITVDDNGMPKAPTLRQLLDKDIKELYSRDPTKDKELYIKECGVIYCLGDPKSPAKQKGLSTKECIKYAIEYYNLPKTYQPDMLVLKIAKRYYDENITEAGVAVEILQQAIHNSAVAIKKLNNYLNECLDASDSIETTKQIIEVIRALKDQSNDIPSIVKRLEEAKQNLMYETEAQLSRGGVSITSSMDGDEYD